MQNRAFQHELFNTSFSTRSFQHKLFNTIFLTRAFFNTGLSTRVAYYFPVSRKRFSLTNCSIKLPFHWRKKIKFNVRTSQICRNFGVRFFMFTVFHGFSVLNGFFFVFTLFLYPTSFLAKFVPIQLHNLFRVFLLVCSNSSFTLPHTQFYIFFHCVRGLTGLIVKIVLQQIHKPVEKTWIEGDHCDEPGHTNW